MSEMHPQEIIHRPEALSTLNAEDLTSLTDIWLSAFPNTDLSRIADNVLEIIGSNHSDVLVDRKLGHIASVAIVSVYYGRDNRLGRIEDVATHPDLMGQGFAGAIIDHAIIWFKNRGVSRIALTSSNEKKAAHLLYLNRGFKIHDTNEFYLDLT